MKFEKNVGNTDRLIRIVLAMLLFLGGFLYLAAPLSYAAYAVGLILLVTGAMQTCPAYSVVGINTMK